MLTLNSPLSFDQQMGFLGDLVMELILLIKPITTEWVELLAEMMNKWNGEERTT